MITKAYTVAKARLAQLGRSLRELCKAANLTRTTVSNALSGQAASRRTQQLLTNILQVRLFDDVNVSECVVVIPRWTKLTCLSFDADSGECVEFGGRVQRDGQQLTFLKPARVVLRFPDLDENPRNQPMEKLVEVIDVKAAPLSQRKRSALETIQEVPSTGPSA